MPQLDLSQLSSIALGVAVIYVIAKLRNVGARDPQLPPGPSTLPILGNLAAIPVKGTWKTFTEWARIYGGVFSLKVSSDTWIVISSITAVHEILEKNGAITAGRPKSEVVDRMVGPTGLFSLAQYGPVWRKWRKVTAEMMKPGARKTYRPIQMAEVTQLLYDTHQDPKSLFYNIQRYNMSSMFSIACGVRTPQTESPLRNKFFELSELISKIVEPGNAPPVDLLPILRYIPDRFARRWKSRTAMIRSKFEEIFFGLVDDAEKRMESGRPNGCFIELILNKAKEWELDREDILWLPTSLIFGGTLTTTSVIQFVVLLATAYPEAQKKVQEELDRVIGVDRAPTLDDMPNLPYLCAFIREVHRFRPEAPLALPHYAEADQIYQGWLIPKDSTLFLNVWGVLHDPDLFDDPEEFDPDRFIRSPYGTKAGVENRISQEALKRIETLQFGIGRRRCVGMAMAINSVDLVSANLLWAFDFSPALDANGSEVKPDVWAFSTGITSDPLPFEFTVKARSSRHADLIKQNFTSSTPLFEMYETDLPDEDREYVKRVRSGFAC